MFAHVYVCARSRRLRSVPYMRSAPWPMLCAAFQLQPPVSHCNCRLLQEQERHPRCVSQDVEVESVAFPAPLHGCHYVHFVRESTS